MVGLIREQRASRPGDYPQPRKVEGGALGRLASLHDFETPVMLKFGVYKQLDLLHSHLHLPPFVRIRYDR